MLFTEDVIFKVVLSVAPCVAARFTLPVPANWKLTQMLTSGTPHWLQVGNKCRPPLTRKSTTGQLHQPISRPGSAALNKGPRGVLVLLQTAACDSLGRLTCSDTVMWPVILPVIERQATLYYVLSPSQDEYYAKQLSSRLMIGCRPETWAGLG